jgi:hypothetical protein
MATDFATFCSTLKDYANRLDWSDDLVTSFVRDAEQTFNAQLRIDRMLKTVVNTIDHECATLPDDWLESDFTLMASETPTGWTPIRYKPRDEFFRLPNMMHTSSSAPLTTYKTYTIQGRTMHFGGPPDTVNGVTFELHYYAEVPVFSDLTPSWVYTRYPSLYRYAALVHADLHAVGEEDKAGGLKTLVDDMIQKLNDAHQRARASGSRLARGHTRSFG